MSDPHMVKLRKQSARFRATNLARCATTNLRRVCDIPNVAGTAFLRGHTAIVVGAGPSLDRNIDDLREVAGQCYVIACNAAVPALEAADVHPDLVVAIEALDVSPTLRHYPTVCSLSSHPSVWARSKGWILEALPYQIAMQLGVRPIHTGGNTLPTAVCLAQHWGARQVVLVGVDLAYDMERGKAYATGSQFGDLVVRRDGDRVAVDGQEERIAWHHKHGIPGPPPSREVLYTTEGWDGGEVTQPIEYRAQWEYLSARGGEGAINATQGGAKLPGWGSVPLLDVPLAANPPTRPVRTGRYVTPRARDAAIERAKLSCVHARDLAHALLEDHPAMDLSHLPDMGLVDAMATGDIVGLQTSPGLTMPQKLRGTYMVWKAAADEVQRLLG